MGERQNVDYEFVTDSMFIRRAQNKEFIEHTVFRGWHYGVPFSEILPNTINVGVFNPQGILSLARYKYDYTIVPVYLETSFSNRMWRSYEREKRWKFEYIRRAITDYFEFRDIKSKLEHVNTKFISVDSTEGL